MTATSITEATCPVYKQMLQLLCAELFCPEQQLKEVTPPSEGLEELQVSVVYKQRVMCHVCCRQ